MFSVYQVAFIGISNWALDPAKMNRGILVQREVPDIEELKNSAEYVSNRPSVNSACWVIFHDFPVVC